MHWLIIFCKIFLQHITLQTVISPSQQIFHHINSVGKATLYNTSKLSYGKSSHVRVRAMRSCPLGTGWKVCCTSSNYCNSPHLQTLTRTALVFQEFSVLSSVLRQWCYCHVLLSSSLHVRVFPVQKTATVHLFLLGRFWVGTSVHQACRSSCQVAWKMS